MQEFVNVGNHPARLVLSCFLILVVVSPIFGLAGKSQSIQAGMWGGEHISMEVAGGQARIEYDCAHGTISGPLVVNARSEFNLRGTHVREHGGPTRIDEKSSSRPAQYAGHIVAKKMTLTVTLSDTGDVLGTFELFYGRTGRVWKCK
jgi:hypothetical protein